MRTPFLCNCVFDEFKRVGRASVLRDRVIIEIDHARWRIENNVFQDGSESPGAGVNLRLRRRGKLDHLGVAAAFKVEYSTIIPPMLVISDQPAGRVS